MVMDRFIVFEPCQLARSIVNKGDKVWKLWQPWMPGCDEGPVSFDASESRQPLSGWLIGRLSKPGGEGAADTWQIRLDDEDLPGGWVEILRTLEFSAEKAAKVAPLYLLATRNGLVVVADGLVQETQAQEQYAQRLGRWNGKDVAPRLPRPIDGLISAQLLRRTRFRFGQWVELSGRPSQFKDTAHRFFVASAATIGTTEKSAGIAGSVIPGSISCNDTFVAFSLRRSQVESAGSVTPVRAPDARVYVEPNPGQSAEKLKNAINAWNTDPGGQFAPEPFMMARGAPMLIPDDSDTNEMTLMDLGQPRLKFVRQEDAVGVFKVPDLTPAAESEAREIRIAIDKTEFHLISGSALLQDDIYAITFGPLSGEILTAIKIVEETWIEGITIKDLLPVSGGRTDRAILVGDEDNKQLLINPQTLVAIEEAMPGETRSRGVGGGGEFAGEEVTGVSEGKQSSERLLGSWAEHGLRVSHAELIGILLRTGFKGTNAVELGNQQATQSHPKATPRPHRGHTRAY